MIGKYMKAVVAGIALIGAALALVLSNYDPSFTQAMIALVAPVGAVATVFMAKNATPDDWSKSVAQLQAAVIYVVGYFTVVPTSTVEKVTILVGAALSAYAVWRVPNEPVA